MPVFPSVEWFQAVADKVNNDPAYRHHGTCDARVGIQVGDCTFRLVFDAFEVLDIAEIPDPSADDLDFTLEMPVEQWQGMLENIQEHGRAELEWTLNSIDLATPHEFAKSDDYDRRDLFYRFNQSFQHFFDSSAGVETRFPESART